MESCVCEESSFIQIPRAVGCWVVKLAIETVGEWRTHETRLDDIDRGAADDGAEAGSQPGQDVAVHVVLHDVGLQQRLLDLRPAPNESPSAQ